jgi:hypothetical protein
MLRGKRLTAVFPRRRHACSITIDFLDEFNKEKTAIEKSIEAVQ